MCQNLPAAVGFSLTPSTVSNTYSGMLTLQVTGLASGQSVVVQKFLDANTNSVIDGADLLWQQFSLTDGQVSVLGGVTNINVPGDTDPTPGQITAPVIFRNTDPVLNVIGKYAYKLSSPTGLFAPITNSFTITNASQAQLLTGNVVNHGTNVPFAAVLLFSPRPGDDGPGSTVGGTMANSAGGYSIKVPPGTYGAVAFKSNFIGNLFPAPITVGSGATVTTNLNLTNATRTLSGRLVDAANPAIGLPGLFIHADGGGSVAVATSDTNGSFSIPVGTGFWNVGAVGVETLGYVNVDADNHSYDTTTGSVSGLVVAFPKAAALFYGTVRDDQNQPLAGVGVNAENNEDYSAWHNSFTDDNGHYVAGALTGAIWDVDVDHVDPALAAYLFPEGVATNLGAGQLVLQNFTALRATNHIAGHLLDNTGGAISNVQIYAYAGIGGKFYYLDTETDASGGYSLTVANGNWTVGVCLDCNDENLNYCQPDNQNVTLSNANAVANFTSPGKLDIPTPSPLPAGRVDEEYSFQFTAITCASGTNWSVSNPPPGLEILPSGELYGYPETPGSNYFFVQVSDGSGGAFSKGFSLTILPTTNGGVTTYYAGKLRNYRQTNAANVFLDGTQGPYHAYLGIIQDSLDQVTNASCTLPASGVKGFPPGGSALELQVHEVFAGEPALDAAYQWGSFSFAMQTRNQGNRFPVLNLPATAYPNAPRISNYAAAQAINAGSDFLLRWDFFSGGSNDSIRIVIVDTNQVPALKLGWYAYPEEVYEELFSGDTDSVNIQAGSLQADHTYLGMLQFFRFTHLNEVDYTNAQGLAFVGAQTVFSLTTTSLKPVLSQPVKVSPTQFSFRLTGSPGQNYTIQKSTNLSSTNWSFLLVAPAPTTVFDTVATNNRAFYRAMVGP